MLNARSVLHGVVALWFVVFAATDIMAKEVILQIDKSVSATDLTRSLGLEIIKLDEENGRVLVDFPESITLEEARTLLVAPGSPISTLEMNQSLEPNGRPQSFIDKLPSYSDFVDQPSRHIILGSDRELPPLSFPNPGSKVAVFDTGIDPYHPFFENRHFESGYDYVEGDHEPFDAQDGLDNDRDGAIDEYFGHGTSVTSLLLLINPGAVVLPYRVIDADGVGSLFDLLSAMDHARGAGAQVFHLSASFEDPSDLLETTLRDARAQGILTIASAGNSGRREERYPAAYDFVIGVGATTHADVLDSEATRGSSIDIVAPGVDSIAAIPDGGYAVVSGSSLATPLIAATSLLLFAEGASVDEVESALRAGAVDITENNPGDEDSLGSGRLSVPGSLAAR